MLQFEALIGAFLILIVVFIVVSILINALFLGVALGFVNGQNRELGTTFVTALGMALLGWIPILGCILSWYLIKIRHNVGWGGAIVAWLLCGFIAIIVVVIIIFVFLGGIAFLLPTTFTWTFTFT